MFFSGGFISILGRIVFLCVGLFLCIIIFLLFTLILFLVILILIIKMVIFIFECIELGWGWGGGGGGWIENVCLLRFLGGLLFTLIYLF